MNMKQVRAYVDPDEPDYAAAAVALGADALPHLAELASGEDPMIASKAVYLAGLIGGDDAQPIVWRGAEHRDPAVRVAAAACVKNLDQDAALELGQRLLKDDDAGVRKVAVRAAGQLEFRDVRAKLRKVAQSDKDEFIRSLAADLEA